MTLLGHGRELVYFACGGNIIYDHSADCDIDEGKFFDTPPIEMQRLGIKGHLYLLHLNLG